VRELDIHYSQVAPCTYAFDPYSAQEGEQCSSMDGVVFGTLILGGEKFRVPPIFWQYVEIWRLQNFYSL